MGIAELIAQMLINATGQMPPEQMEQAQAQAKPFLGPEGTTFYNTGDLVELRRRANRAYLQGNYDEGDRLQKMVEQMAGAMSKQVQ